MDNRKNIETTAIRSSLEASQGQEYWRSLDELSQTDEFAAMVEREFPEQASELNDPVSRRNFLKKMLLARSSLSVYLHANTCYRLSNVLIQII